MHYKAMSRNKQLLYYEKNWAAYEIMKTIIKNKRNYRAKLGRAGDGKAYDKYFILGLYAN